MEKEELINNAYEVFSSFSKPEQMTEYTDWEGSEFNAMLISATRRSLSIEQLGTSAWNPIPSMSSGALAYFMPRLIELAVSNALDCDGEPFFCLFINSFFQGPSNKKYNLFGQGQKMIMAESFKYLLSRYSEQLELEGWLEETRQAVENWSGA